MSKHAIYVASKFENATEVQRVYGLLQAKGHEITHDWTRECADGLTGGDLDHYLKRCAEDDLEGVANADAVFLLQHKDMRGAYVECGAAIAWGIPVLVVGAKDKPWYRLPIFYRLGKPSVFEYECVEDAVLDMPRIVKRYGKEP